MAFTAVLIRDYHFQVYQNRDEVKVTCTLDSVLIMVHIQGQDIEFDILSP